MTETIFEARSETGIPWADRKSWRAANHAVAYHLKRYPAVLKKLNIPAQKIQSSLLSVFPVLNDLCADSCPWCPEPCCLNASVWFDFKDLLFLHFNELLIPPCQPKADLKAPCCYLGSKGCRLPRINRPWICTWYLCPTQTAKLKKESPAKHKLLNQAFAQIKSDRKLLENEYIRIIS